MDAKTVLALANGAVGMLEQLGPELASLFSKGEITPEQQQALDDRVSALRPGGTAFSGPEWKVE